MVIDNEFQRLIPPLSADEFNQLEQNILQEGIRDALVTWNGILIDGHNRYSIDIDFLLLEFDEGKARALVEYKNEHAKTQRTGHPSYKALIDLGDRAGVPVFACRYSDDFVKWVVFPLNEKAKPLLPPEWGTKMTEREYVSFLYELRGKEAPGILLSQLNG